ncbi:hypothetical protein AB205_0171590, partial [Aquarana catesbeiana]
MKKNPLWIYGLKNVLTQICISVYSLLLCFHFFNHFCFTFIDFCFMSPAPFSLFLFPSIRKFAKQWHQYHSKIDELIEETVKEMITLLVAKFVTILEGVLSKLSRYDEGTLFSSFLSFTVKAASKYVDVPKPGMDVADAYVTFVRHSQDVLRDKVNEEIYIERLFD